MVIEVADGDGDRFDVKGLRRGIFGFELCRERRRRMGWCYMYVCVYDFVVERRASYLVPNRCLIYDKAWWVEVVVLLFCFRISCEEDMRMRSSSSSSSSNDGDGLCIYKRISHGYLYHPPNIAHTHACVSPSEQPLCLHTDTT